MTRVTFGIKSSPFLLAATIKHHIKGYQTSYPEAYEILNETIYVDDLVASVNSLKKAIQVTKDAKFIMQEANMNLRKWRSNSTELIQEWQCSGFEDGLDTTTVPIKVLGIVWCTLKDEFKLDLNSIAKSIDDKNNTKRSILQISAKLFDLLGFVTPFTLKIKLLFQKLWECGVNWDEDVPESMKIEWNNWCSDVTNLQKFYTIRYYFNWEHDLDNNIYQIHLFCDASLTSYGAVAYVRYASKEDEWRTTFIMSKSRIAPVKKISLPRLELMGALIGARLVKQLKQVFCLSNDNLILWTDSQIALYWIKGPARKWKQFVANRVMEIQEITDPKTWKHCRSRDNPADLLTRGCSVEELINNKKWWNGPEWLKQEEESWAKSNIDLHEDEVTEKGKRFNLEIAVHLVNEGTKVNSSEDLEKQKKEQSNFMLKYSSWTTLQRITAWCLRFIYNIKSPDHPEKGFLNIEEINRATNTIIRLIQQSEFAKEYASLSAKKDLSSNSRLITLNPFLDNKRVMRVGGRLKNANIPEEAKYPIILPKLHFVTTLIIRHYHENHLHGGTQLLQSAIRQNYWIMNAKSAIRKCLGKCVQCCRVRGEVSSQLMADLPPSRVLEGRVFSKVGVDFAGPFQIKPKKGRGVKSIKCYVCLYVCFITKAVHLEVVTELSTESFIASLKRFTSRRGKPCEIYSDCGTNFVGASNELKKVVSSLRSSDLLHKYLVTENMRCKFNPPAASHFGGLWEAGVKSMKHHLKRTVGVQILTFEEFQTVVIQIEACLNSRPLVSVSSDPKGLCALTPGHFIIGTSLTAIPESDLTEEKLTLTERWKLTQQIVQSFWKRWSMDYLSQLQQRPKWTKIRADLKINDLVLIKEDNQPPLRWRLGRVLQTYPGTDGKVRTVDLHTATGNLKRSIVKLCYLPIDN